MSNNPIIHPHCKHLSPNKLKSLLDECTILILYSDCLELRKNPHRRGTRILNSKILRDYIRLGENEKIKRIGRFFLYEDESNSILEYVCDSENIFLCYSRCDHFKYCPKDVCDKQSINKYLPPNPVQRHRTVWELVSNFEKNGVPDFAYDNIKELKKQFREIQKCFGLAVNWQRMTEEGRMIMLDKRELAPPQILEKYEYYTKKYGDLHTQAVRWEKAQKNENHQADSGRARRI